MVPPSADHATATSDVPITVAVKCTVFPGSIDAEIGSIETSIRAAAAMETAAVAVLLASALLAATTWNVPVVAGATYIPSAPMDPPGVPSRTDHLTDVSAVPETAAVKRCVPAVGRLTD